MNLEEAMNLLWVGVVRMDDEGPTLIYEGPLSGAPGPIQAAFALDCRCDPPGKVAAMWVIRHAIQIPPYLVAADLRDGVRWEDVAPYLKAERIRHPLEDYFESLLREEEKDA